MEVYYIGHGIYTQWFTSHVQGINSVTSIAPLLFHDWSHIVQYVNKAWVAFPTIKAPSAYHRRQWRNMCMWKANVLQCRFTVSHLYDVQCFVRKPRSAVHEIFTFHKMSLQIQEKMPAQSTHPLHGADWAKLDTAWCFPSCSSFMSKQDLIGKSWTESGSWLPLLWMWQKLLRPQVDMSQK